MDAQSATGGHTAWLSALSEIENALRDYDQFSVLPYDRASRKARSALKAIALGTLAETVEKHRTLLIELTACRYEESFEAADADVARWIPDALRRRRVIHCDFDDVSLKHEQMSETERPLTDRCAVRDRAKMFRAVLTDALSGKSLLE
jgi:hypothetical protein